MQFQKESCCLAPENLFPISPTLMLHRLFQILTSAILLAAFTGHCALLDRTAIGERTALDRYVRAPDTNYSFRLANTIKGEGYTTYIIDMTSQSWLTTNEVN